MNTVTCERTCARCNRITRYPCRTDSEIDSCRNLETILRLPKSEDVFLELPTTYGEQQVLEQLLKQGETA